jgi:hypothetical protein
MDTADDDEVRQTVLYHLNMEHAVQEIEEMVCFQFPLDYEKQWSQGRRSATLTMTDMWGPTRDGGVIPRFFADKKAWRLWLHAVHEVIRDWEGFDDWDWAGFKDIRNMGINKLELHDFCKLAVRVLIFFIKSFITHLGYFPSPMLCPLILANQHCTRHKKKFATGIF